METKEYQIGELKVYQNAINIRQAKELSKLFADKNILGGEFDFTVQPGVLAASIFETGCVEDFMNIVLTQKSGAKFEEKIKEDALELNFLTEVCRDFFSYNPSLSALFGSSNVRQALMKANSLLGNIENGAKSSSPNSSGEILEQPESLKSGTESANRNEEQSNLKLHTHDSSMNSAEETPQDTQAQS